MACGYTHRMSDDLDHRGEFHALLEAALLSAPASISVELDSAHGREVLLSFKSEDDRVCGGGTLIIPADTPESRRRWAVTRGCPRCPDVNQGLMSQELDLGPAGTHILALYEECGHGATAPLDRDEDPFVFSVTT